MRRFALLAFGIAAFARGAFFGGRQFHPRAFAQTVHTVDNHQFAGLDARLDDGHIRFGGAGLHFAQRHRAVVLDDIHEHAAGAALQRRARHRRRVAPHIDQHAHVDELIGKQPAVIVRELRLQAHGAGGGVDLVVDGQQHAGAEQVLLVLVAVQRLDRDALAGLHALHHDRQVVLRQRKDDGDRLLLRDHDQAVGVAGAHDVALVDLAQAETPADRRRHARVGELQARVVEQALIEFDGALVLADQGLLRIELLFGD